MLSIFSCACWPSVCLLRRNVYLGLLPIFLFFFFLNLFYFWPHWVFLAARRLSLVAVSGGYSLLWCAGFSLSWLFLLQSTGSRRAGFSSCGAHASVVVACMLSCSMACGIFPNQGSNPCPLRWQVDS